MERNLVIRPSARMCTSTSSFEVLDEAQVSSPLKVATYDAFRLGVIVIAAIPLALTPSLPRSRLFPEITE